MSWDYIDPRDLPPEEMKPDGVVTLLVGITRHGEFNYYVLPRHLVYLDAEKDESGNSLYAGEEGRFGIMTVDEAHEDAYFQAIEPYKRSLEQLKEELYACKNRHWRAAYWTEVLMDFDRHHFTSYFAESFYFPLERYVPDGWTSEFGGLCVPGGYFFVDDGPDGLPPESLDVDGPGRYYIPLDKRFWIDEKGRSLFELLYQEGVKSGREKPWPGDLKKGE